MVENKAKKPKFDINYAFLISIVAIVGIVAMFLSIDNYDQERVNEDAQDAGLLATGFVVSDSSTESGAMPECFESDWGFDPRNRGQTHFGRSTGSDSCRYKDISNGMTNYVSTKTCEGSDCFIQEVYCDPSASLGISVANMACPTGCSYGACEDYSNTNFYFADYYVAEDGTYLQVKICSEARQTETSTNILVNVFDMNEDENEEYESVFWEDVNITFGYTSGCTKYVLNHDAAGMQSGNSYIVNIDLDPYNNFNESREDDNSVRYQYSIPGLICTDSDLGYDPNKFGISEYAGQEEKERCVQVIKRWFGFSREYLDVESCSGDDCYVLENTCLGEHRQNITDSRITSELVRCDNGCYEGACNTLDENSKYCDEYDGGDAPSVAGYIYTNVWSRYWQRVGPDYCMIKSTDEYGMYYQYVDSCSGEDCYQLEFLCRSSTEVDNAEHKCDSCDQGKCSETRLICNSNQAIGDLNNDGSISITDRTLLNNIVLGFNLAPENICCTDLNQDGHMGISDLVKFDRIISGLDNSPGFCGDSESCSFHDADYTKDWKIDNSELNRILAYQRAEGYHCDSSGYDGYAPGLNRCVDNQDCYENCMYLNGSNCTNSVCENNYCEQTHLVEEIQNETQTSQEISAMNDQQQGIYESEYHSACSSCGGELVDDTICYIKDVCEYEQEKYQQFRTCMEQNGASGCSYTAKDNEGCDGYTRYDVYCGW